MKQITLANRLDAVENYTDRTMDLDRLLIENPGLYPTLAKSIRAEPLNDYEGQAVLAYNRKPSSGCVSAKLLIEGSGEPERRQPEPLVRDLGSGVEVGPRRLPSRRAVSVNLRAKGEAFPRPDQWIE